MSTFDVHKLGNAGPAARSSLEGFRVRSADSKDAGRIARSNKHGFEVVTGRWLLAQTVTLPAESIIDVDFEQETVLVTQALNEITSAPLADRRTGTPPYAGVWWPYAGSWWPWMR